MIPTGILVIRSVSTSADTTTPGTRVGRHTVMGVGAGGTATIRGTGVMIRGTGDTYLGDTATAAAIGTGTTTATTAGTIRPVTAT